MELLNISATKRKWRQLKQYVEAYPRPFPPSSLEVKRLLEKDYELQKVLVSVEKARYTLK